MHTVPTFAPSFPKVVIRSFCLPSNIKLHSALSPRRSKSLNRYNERWMKTIQLSSEGAKGFRDGQPNTMGCLKQWNDCSAIANSAAIGAGHALLVLLAYPIAMHDSYWSAQVGNAKRQQHWNHPAANHGLAQGGHFVDREGKGAKEYWVLIGGQGRDGMGIWHCSKSRVLRLNLGTIPSVCPWRLAP